MKILSVSLSMGLIASLWSSSAFAGSDIEDRLERIERKLHNIDRGIDQILSLLDGNESHSSRRTEVKVGVDTSCVDSFVQNQRKSGYTVPPSSLEEFAKLCKKKLSDRLQCEFSNTEIDTPCVNRLVAHQRESGYTVPPSTLTSFAGLCTTDVYVCRSNEG